MKWIKKLLKLLKPSFADPYKDIRCKGCSHVDSPLYPYPDYCNLMKPTPTCYNCKHSIYGAGPEGCKIHGDVPLTGSSACPEHEYYN